MVGWLVLSLVHLLRAMAAVAVVAVAALCVGAGQRDALAGSVTLDAVRDRGLLRCGVHRSGIGLAEVNADGYWSGYFVEYCRIVAAATLGDPQAVHFVEVDDISATLALRGSLADVVISTLAPGETGAAGQSDDGDAIAYVSPILTDRLTLVPYRGVLRNAADLSRNARVCAGSHDAYARAVELALAGGRPDVQVVRYESIEGLFNAFFRQRCEAVSYHDFAVRAQGVLRAPSQQWHQQAGLDLGEVEFRPSIRTGDTEWLALVDMIIRVARFDATVDLSAVGSLGAGRIQRIRAIAPTPSAVFERTLGRDGGQGFQPARPASAA